MHSFLVFVLGFLFVSFRPSSLRFPQLFHECFPFAFAFGLSPSDPLSFVRFSSGSGYSAFCFFRSLLPGLASQWLFQCPASAFASSAFPVLSCLISHTFFPGFGTWLSVCFLSSFPVSLPQPFHRCFPSFLLPCVRFFSGLSACFPVSFVPFSLRLTTQPSALSFPFFPFSPGSGSFGALWFLSSPSLSSDLRPVSMPSFRFRYSASCISFRPFSVSPHSGYSQLASFRLLFRMLPLGFRFRFCLLGLSFCVFYSRIDLTHITTGNTKCQHLFFVFLNYYLVFCYNFAPLFLLVFFRRAYIHG